MQMLGQRPGDGQPKAAAQIPETPPKASLEPTSGNGSTSQSPPNSSPSYSAVEGSPRPPQNPAMPEKTGKDSSKVQSAMEGIRLALSMRCYSHSFNAQVAQLDLDQMKAEMRGENDYETFFN